MHIDGRQSEDKERKLSSISLGGRPQKGDLGDPASTLILEV